MAYSGVSSQPTSRNDDGDKNCDSHLRIEYVKIPEVDCTKISENKRKEIEAKFQKAQRTAAETYQTSLQMAEDTKAEAESKYTLAEAKYKSAIKTLKIQIDNAIADSCQAYEECLLDPACKEIHEDKKAICATQFNEALSAKQVDFYTGKQKLDQTKATAYAAWIQAQTNYDLAKELADKVQENAEKQAESQKYDDISKALQDYFDS